MRPRRLPSGLLMRPYEDGDAEAIHDTVQENRDRLIATMPWAPFAAGPGDFADFISSSRRQEEEGTGLQRGLFDGPRFVGSIGATIEPLNRVGDVGYWIDVRWEGKGAVSEATAALIDHLVEVEGVHRVVIRAAVANRRSRSVAERFGFIFEGILRESLILDGVPTDAAVYSLLAPEWRARG